MMAAELTTHALAGSRQRPPLTRSAVLRFGSRANDWDSTIYAYVESRSAPSRLIPERWLLAGSLPCRTKGDFDRREWAEGDPATWPQHHTADFGQYAGLDSQEYAADVALTSMRLLLGFNLRSSVQGIRAVMKRLVGA